MDGKVVIETELGTKSFERQIAKLEDELEGLVATYEILSEDSTFNMQSVEAIKLREDIEKVNNRLIEMRKKQKDLNDAPFTGIKEAIGNIGNGIQATIKKVAKWGLAVFGVRGAYMFVRNAMSELASQDDGMAVKLEYIRWALANTIKPVIEWIINAVYKILGLFGGLIKAITGYNIFATATTKNFEKMKKSTSGIKKNTGSIKKDLYGWDEMTRVTESGGAFGGGGGIGDGIQDALKNLPDLQKLIDKYSKMIKDWFKKIKKWFLGGDTLKEGLKNAPQQIIDFYKKALKPVYKTIIKPYLEDPIMKMIEDLKPVWQPVKTEFETLIENMKTKWQELVGIIKPNVIDPISNEFSTYKNEFLKGFTPFINDIIDDINSVFWVFGIHLNHINDDTQKTGENIANKIGGSLSDTITGTKKLKTSFDDLPKIVKTTLDVTANTTKARKNIVELLKDIGSAGIEGAVGIQGSIESAIRKIKVRKGAIINLPGRGIPVGNAYGGEAGQEGVIPLTDSQQMELLGEAIGRYITINANITNTMNGRVISRELQKIQSENNFAGNR